MKAIHPLHLLMFVGVMTVWGFNFAVLKTGVAQIPPIFFVMLRFIVVALVLSPLMPRPPTPFPRLLLISFSLGLLHFATMFTAVKYLDAATAAIAIQLQVPFAAILANYFFDDRLGWRRALGMVTAFIGVAIVAGEPRLAGNYLPLAMVIVAACIWSFANVQIKLMGNISGFALNAWVAMLSIPQLAVATLILEQGQLAALMDARWTAYFAIAYQSLIVVVCGYGAWYWLLQRYDVNQVMPFTLLVPIFGVLSGVIFLGESLTVQLLIGAAFTIVGVGIVVFRRPLLTSERLERL